MRFNQSNVNTDSTGRTVMLILRLQLLATQRQLYVPTRRNGNKSWGFHFMFIIYLHSKLHVMIPIT